MHNYNIFNSKRRLDNILSRNGIYPTEDLSYENYFDRNNETVGKELDETKDKYRFRARSQKHKVITPESMDEEDARKREFSFKVDEDILGDLRNQHTTTAAASTYFVGAKTGTRS